MVEDVIPMLHIPEELGREHLQPIRRDTDQLAASILETFTQFFLKAF